MKMIGAPHGLQDSLIHPLAKYSSIYYLKRDLDISMSFCLTVTNQLPGDKFTVRL